MEVYRFGVKFFAADPVSIPLPDFIPVFHTWVQKQIIENHLLIDIHNYSHIQRGPGILLVAHEGNFSTDMAENRLGLLYYRKHPTTGTTEELLMSILKPALQACILLENEPSLSGRLHFRTDEFQIVANDRLNAPNDEKTFSELEPLVFATLRGLYDGATCTVTRISRNPKERFGVHAQADQSPGMKVLLSRCRGGHKPPLQRERDYGL